MSERQTKRARREVRLWSNGKQIPGGLRRKAERALRRLARLGVRPAGVLRDGAIRDALTWRGGKR